MLKDCIAPRIAQTAQMEELFAAEQPELELLQETMLSWIAELHILTSTRNIEPWEREYALDHNTELTLEQRRARIFAKKCSRKISRVQFLEDTIKTLLNARGVDVLELDCEFEIFVETIGLIDNFSIAENFFHDVRPAHWGFHFINALKREYDMKTYLGVHVFTHKNFEVEVAE